MIIGVVNKQREKRGSEKGELKCVYVLVSACVLGVNTDARRWCVTR